MGSSAVVVSEELYREGDVIDVDIVGRERTCAR